MKIKHDKLNLHRVHVEFSGQQVRDMLLDRIAEKLDLDRSEVGKHLRVDLQSGVTDTTYVRGEVPMTREQVLWSLKSDHSAEDLASLREVAQSTLDRDPWDKSAAALLKVVDVLDGPGPATGPNPGTQIGTGHYVPGSEELPEVQVDRAEVPATIAVHTVCNDLTTVIVALDQASESFTTPSIMEHVALASSILRSLKSTLDKYSACVLTEGGDPVVPRRGPTTDVIDTAREKVKALYEQVTLTNDAVRPRDLTYLYKLLGGGDL